MESVQAQKQRYELLDAVRGLAVINMVLFHFCFDLFVLSGADPGWYQRPLVIIWQQGICQTFIFISGMAWALGSNQLKRGLKLNLIGFGITVVTFFAMPEQLIWFGILTFLGCACLILVPLKQLLSRLPAVAGFLGFYFLFLVTRNISAGYVGTGDLKLFLPEFLYEHKVFTALGFPFEGFVSGDYFPLFPWIFLYIAGYFAFRLSKKWDRVQELLKTRLPILTKTGQHSLVIYVIHQPVCLAVCMILLKELL